MPARTRRSQLSWALPVVLALAVATLSPAASAAPAPAASRLTRAVLDATEGGGQADVLVLLRDQADLATVSAAPAASGSQRTARVKGAYDALRATAERSQAGLRGLLATRGVKARSLWIANALSLRADRALAGEIAARPEVEQVLLSETVQVPKAATAGPAQAGGIEWNIERVRAPGVWDKGFRGQGVVIGSIDTGVQFDHPALVRSYRGNKGGGNFDHNYNFTDTTGECDRSLPCDASGHGTATMGIMVGEDGANRIGMAPGATWMSAKACDRFSSCTLPDLLAAGQWILAPTDVNGANPRPEMAPQVVSNSWGKPGHNPGYRRMVEAWHAAGILPVFSAGNDGACKAIAAPAAEPAAIAVGASDKDDKPAYFSSYGPSRSGEPKPNMSAPGLDIRSAALGGRYTGSVYPDSFGGTSAAAPPGARAAAPIWSAPPPPRGAPGQTPAAPGGPARPRRRG